MKSLVLQWQQGQVLQASQLSFQADGSHTQHSAFNRKEQSWPIWPHFKIRCREKSLRMEIQRLGFQPWSQDQVACMTLGQFLISPRPWVFNLWMRMLTWYISPSTQLVKVWCLWLGVRGSSSLLPLTPSRRAEFTSLWDQKSQCQRLEGPFETNLCRLQGWDSFCNYVRPAKH